MFRTDIINHLIKTYGFERYLEIGVWDKELNFNKIECKRKSWCDPRAEVSLQEVKQGEFVGYTLTSDQMFELFETEQRYKDDDAKFDLIFIDGLHLAEQVVKDLNNSVRYLSDNGIIVVHDCNPAIKELATEEWILSEWCGTVWKGYISWCITRYHLYDYNTVDTDYGVGIIRKQKNLLFGGRIKQKITLDWEYFDKNRKELLNLITEEEFKNIYK